MLRAQDIGSVVTVVENPRCLGLHVYVMFSDSHFATGWLILSSIPGRSERLSLLTIQTDSGDHFSGYQAFPLVIKRLQCEADH